MALEATGNSDAIANLLMPLVGRVVVSNPSKTRAIAEAKVKTDKVDARILAQLLAADFLPRTRLRGSAGPRVALCCDSADRMPLAGPRTGAGCLLQDACLLIVSSVLVGPAVGLVV